MKTMKFLQTGAALTITSLALAACGAGSDSPSNSAATSACDFDNPSSPTTVNVLAYNSSAIDPYTNSMVNSCSKDNVTVKHEPIDFAGQVQRTQATLGTDNGTYDLIESYGFVIPGYADQDKLVPLDDLYTEFTDQYKLDGISQDLKDRLSYDGHLWAVPMQAQAFTFVYRKDVFDELGLEVPTTFQEMEETAKKIQDSGKMKNPLALPWLSSSDLGTAYVAALGSLGKQYVDEDTRRPNFDSDESRQALEAMKALTPYMDPQALTFDQPKVQQQLFNDQAAMAIMFSGRMADLQDENQTSFSDQFAFAAPPSVEDGGKLYSQVSIDGWSIPKNTKVDNKLLFNLIGASVSEEASEASIPDAYPAREGVANQDNMDYADAVETAISEAPDPQLVPWAADINNETINVLAQIISGQKDIDAGMREMQQIAERVMEKY